MLTKVEPVKITKADIEAKEIKNIKKMTAKDIQEIEKVLTIQEKDVLVSTHKKMDGKYQAAILDWGKSMYGYNPDYGFAYELISDSGLVDNLEIMKAKIEAFGEGINSRMAKGVNKNINIDVAAHAESVVHNELNVDIVFRRAKDDINNLTALSKEQVDEINEKLSELEKILLSEEKKRNKWEKAQPVFKYIIDKGLDVAKIVLPLIKEF